MAECDSEQAAAAALGYDEASWDDESGKARTPLAARLPWTELPLVLKRAAKLLGYTQVTWGSRDTVATQPASFYKQWTELTTCGECKVACNAGTKLSLWKVLWITVRELLCLECDGCMVLSVQTSTPRIALLR